MSKKFNVIYQITNQINDKIYIGKHSTNNINDNYMGSGIHIKRAIAKYGIENFTKEILHVYDSESLAYAKEAEIVDYEFIERNDTYNLICGGKGGLSSNVHYLCGRIALNKNGKIRYVFPEDAMVFIEDGWIRGGIGIKNVITESGRKTISDNMKKNNPNSDGSVARGKIKINKNSVIKTISKHDVEKFISLGWELGSALTMSDENKRLLSIRMQGNNNPNYGGILFLGKIYMNMNGRCTLIDKKEIDKYLSDGWKFGSGKSHSKETRRKISLSRLGENNPNFGKPTANKNKKCVNKDGKCKFVDISEVDVFLSDGWELGGIKWTIDMKNKASKNKSRLTPINKNGKTRYIDKDILDDFLLDDWVLGTGRKMSNIQRKKHSEMMKNNNPNKSGISPIKGKKCIHKDGKNKFVTEDKIKTYLQQGWILGGATRTCKIRGD